MTERGQVGGLAAAILLIAMIGVGLRLWHIGSTPMWLDEAYSAYAAGKSFAFVWQIVPRYETHPPFYYSVLRLWTLAFGDGLVAERALGLAAGLCTPPAIAWNAAAAARWQGWATPQRRLAALIAFALAAFSIPLVEMSREVRPYPIMLLVYALATRAVLAMAERSRAGRPLPSPVFTAYCVCLALMLWLHSLGPLWGAALGLAALAAVTRRNTRRADWGWFVAGHAAVALLYLPALAILADQAPTWVHSTWLRFSWTSLGDHLPVLYAVPGWQSIAAALLALFAIGALAREPRRRRLLVILLMLALVPATLSVLLSITVAPVFITRTMTPVAAPWLVLLALGAAALPGRGRWLGIGAAVMLGANMLSVDIQQRGSPPIQDWYPAVDWLARRHAPGDLILAYPNEGALPLERALKDKKLDWRVMPIPGPVPADAPGGWHPTGSRGVTSLPDAALRTIARSPAIAPVRRVWLLRLGASTYDPGDRFLLALRRDRRVTARYRAEPIDIIGLERR